MSTFIIAHVIQAIKLSYLLDLIALEQEQNYRPVKLRTGGCVICHRRTALYRMPFCGRCLRYVGDQRSEWPGWLMFLARYKWREQRRIRGLFKDEREIPFCEYEDLEQTSGDSLR